MDTTVPLMRVALIEDNPADVGLVREALRHGCLDCELVVFRTFEQAITAVETGHLAMMDAVLIDLNLHTGSGLDILEALRSSETAHHASVAVLTSSDSPRDRDAAMHLGANLYIRKPTDLDAFLHDVSSGIHELINRAERASVSG